jgi:hypothetical protein
MRMELKHKVDTKKVTITTITTRFLLFLKLQWLIQFLIILRKHSGTRRSKTQSKEEDNAPTPTQVHRRDLHTY